MTRLSTFIANNTEQILTEWEVFARALPQGDTMDVAALRDHAKEMLSVIQRDLEIPQSERQRADKSKGKSDAFGRTMTAAHAHGAGRADSGYTVAQMVAEFRALRATVIRLWTEAERRASAEELEDLTRFNEAIDQAIAESIDRFTSDIDHSKDMFLAILGHDLRTPLGAVMMAAKFMLEEEDNEKLRRTLTSQIVTSADRMNKMIGDLLDFTRGRFGDGIPIDRQNVDLRTVCREVAAEVGASYPRSNVQLEIEGDLRGQFDRDRVSQALTNLIGNAIQHGDVTSAVTVRAIGLADEVVLSVHNLGPEIPKNELQRIFAAMAQLPATGQRDRRHLGLGLYIVERIVTAHGGNVEVESSAEDGTTFTIHLPRASVEKTKPPRSQRRREHAGRSSS